MARTALKTDEIKIEQPEAPDLEKTRLADRESPIQRVDNDMLDKDQLDRLAFMDEEVTIRIEPSGGENAPDSYPVWCNGDGGEVKMADGRWVKYGYFPVGVDLITKRKYAAILVGSKSNTVRHNDEDSAQQRPKVTTSAACNILIVEDRNPRGPAFFAEIRRRNF